MLPNLAVVIMRVQAAAEAGVVLVGGSLPERSKGKLYNTCCVFSSKGQLLAKHRCAASHSDRVHLTP